MDLARFEVADEHRNLKAAKAAAREALQKDATPADA
jgi:hypothetical protein